MSSRRHILNGIAVALALGPALVAAPARAENFPDRPIRIVVPFPAGQGTDLAVRVLVEQMNKRLPQPIIVDNRPGADAAVGASLVAKAKPDGYTLVMGTNASHAANAAFGGLPYDPVKDFDPIGLFYGGGMVLLASPSSPVQDMQQFLAAARAKPGSVNIGVASTTARAVFALIKEGFGLDIVSIPYKGSAGALTDLLGGHVSFVVESMTATVPRIKAGELRALAISPARVSRQLPNVPTLEQSGATKGSSLGTWTALFAPKGTPSAVIAVLNKSMNEALQSVPMQEFLSKVGSDSLTSTPAEAAAHVQSEVVRWAEIVKKYGVTQD